MSAQLNIRLSEEDLEAIDFHRMKTGMPRSTFVRSILIKERIITP